MHDCSAIWNGYSLYLQWLSSQFSLPLWSQWRHLIQSQFCRAHSYTFSFLCCRFSLLVFAMENLGLALPMSLYNLFIQTLMESKPSSTLENQAVINTFSTCNSSIDSNEFQLAISIAALYDYCISCGPLCFDDQLRWWMKPTSTTWFSDKSGVVDLCYHLWPSIRKKNMKFRLTILVEIWVCITLFKLTEGTHSQAVVRLFHR